MNVHQIAEHLDEIGETGSAKIVRGDLYTQVEENSDWLFCGSVDDEPEAEEILDTWFLFQNNR